MAHKSTNNKHENAYMYNTNWQCLLFATVLNLKYMYKSNVRVTDIIL